MQILKYLRRLCLPCIVLLFLVIYVDYIAAGSNLPIVVLLAAGLVCGFIAPQGKWRWAILVGAGIPLTRVIGHWLASSQLPVHQLIPPVEILRNLILALLASYTGIFLRQRFFEPQPKEVELSPAISSSSTSEQLITTLKPVASKPSTIVKKAVKLESTAEKKPIAPAVGPAKVEISPKMMETSTPAPKEPVVTDEKGASTSTPQPKEPRSRRLKSLEDFEDRIGLRRWR
ncbi:MAG: hypothetical protein FJY65_09965 [Calditrichaeota bacterium]|nr:hypothetical protein [Calditrichota bacterium]